MNRLFQFSLLVFFIFLSSNFLFSNPSRIVIIKEISINGRPITPSEFNNIILADSDTIMFKYDLDVPSDSPFLYNLILNNFPEISERPAGSNVVHYSNLKEGDYTFEVSAFALKGE